MVAAGVLVFTVVEGRQIVRDGQLVSLDMAPVLQRQARLVARLADAV